eukprot:CCRYP_012610-RA/>CCRYP_012610-RA protein AED:0.48 eAED:0.48 QI:112/1/1/1/0/0/2/65/53
MSRELIFGWDTFMTSSLKAIIHTHKSVCLERKIWGLLERACGNYSKIITIFKV